MPNRLGRLWEKLESGTTLNRVLINWSKNILSSQQPIHPSAVWLVLHLLVSFNHLTELVQSLTGIFRHSLELSKGSGNKATRKPNGCRGNTQRRDTLKDESEREREREILHNQLHRTLHGNKLHSNK